MTKNDFIKIIDTSGDIMFECCDKDFTILTWTPDGIIIGEAFKDNDSKFETAEDLINQYQIDSKPLSELIDKINIKHYS